MYYYSVSKLNRSYNDDDLGPTFWAAAAARGDVGAGWVTDCVVVCE